MPGRVRLGLGPLTGQALDDTSAAAAAELETLLAASVAADERGLDSVWVSEHHLSGDGYLTSPLVLLAALARETSSVILGTNVALAPLHTPLRLAEDATLVDHLSGGRLVLGLGLGYRDVEYAAFGVTRASRVRRLEQTVEVLRAAWRGDDHSGAGPVSPRPPRPGGVPILLGGYAEPAVRRAARVADGWIAPTLADPDELRLRLGWLAEDGAFARPFRVVVNIAAFVADPDVDAWAVAAPGVRHVEERYRAWRSEQTGSVRSADPGVDFARPPAYVVVGDPATCAHALAPWHAALSAAPATAIPHLNVRLHYPGVGREATVRAVHLFADEIAPALGREEERWTAPSIAST